MPSGFFQCISDATQHVDPKTPANERAMHVSRRLVLGVEIERKVMRCTSVGTHVRRRVSEEIVTGVSLDLDEQLCVAKLDTGRLLSASDGI